VPSREAAFEVLLFGSETMSWNFAK